MAEQSIRNIAIIAHVDHGKTTLVDQFLRQSGHFLNEHLSGDCILDSNPLERERGITILSKNCAIDYTDRHGERFHINIIDTPGHADFSGEVERVLIMADGVLLLVDAFEGAMPQTRYVLQKALEVGLKPIVVINKMDRPGVRPNEVLDEVLDLLVELDADDHALDFPVIYASGQDGWAGMSAEPPKDGEGDIHALFDAIIEHVPAPKLDRTAPLQMLITTLDYSEYVGRIGIGRVFAGTIHSRRELVVIDKDSTHTKRRVSQLFRFDGLGRKEVDSVGSGDLCAVVGLDAVDIGDTLADLDSPVALPAVRVDEPTLHMTFRINDGPFSGQDGKYVTSKQIAERLHRELQSNVALRVEERGDEFVVSGRGLLHLGILLENMRRDGYELTVGNPEVIYHHEGGRKLEPIETLIISVPNQSIGPVMQLLGDRRAQMVKMEMGDLRTDMEFTIPARGLIGLRNRLLTATQGEAIINHRFLEFGDDRGHIPGRVNGSLIAKDTGRVTALAVEELAYRGVLFVEPGQQVYEGQIIGEHCKAGDLVVNIIRQKKLNNIRQSTKEATVTLKAPRLLMLEDALEYVESEELVELTPKSVRLRKRWLSEVQRKRRSRQKAASNA